MSQQINLLNPALRRSRDWLAAKPLALAAGAALAVVVAIAATLRIQPDGLERAAAAQSAQLKAVQDRLIAAAKEVAARKPNDRLQADLANARVQLQGRQAIMAVLQGGAIGSSSGFADYLRGFARQLPSGLWLTGFAIGAGGSEMEIRGRMLDPAALPEYIRRLNAEPAFQGRSFAALNIRRPQPEAGARTAAAPNYVEFELKQNDPAPAADPEKRP